MTDTVANIYGPDIVAVVIIVALYFVPTIIAFMRHHRQAAAIGALNFFLGWTVIGWIVCLVWCLTNPAHPQVNVINQFGPGGAAGPSAGWYPDNSSGRMRYWSGSHWTEHYRD